MTAPANPSIDRLQAALDRWVTIINSATPQSRGGREKLRQRRIDAVYGVVVRAALTLNCYPGDNVGSIGDVVSALDEVGAIVTAEELLDILASVPSRGAVDDDERRAIIEAKVEASRARASGTPAPSAEAPAAAPRQRSMSYFSDRPSGRRSG
jgi:hypothetical protein